MREKIRRSFLIRSRGSKVRFKSRISQLSHKLLMCLWRQEDFLQCQESEKSVFQILNLEKRSLKVASVSSIKVSSMEPQLPSRRFSTQDWQTNFYKKSKTKSWCSRSWDTPTSPSWWAWSLRFLISTLCSNMFLKDHSTICFIWRRAPSTLVLRRGLESQGMLLLCSSTCIIWVLFTETSRVTTSWSTLVFTLKSATSV